MKFINSPCYDIDQDMRIIILRTKKICRKLYWKQDYESIFLGMVKTDTR